ALQIGARRERLVRAEDDEAGVVLLGEADRLDERANHRAAERPHLRLDREDEDLVVECPGARGVVLEDGLAGVERGRRVLPEQRRAEDLTTVDGQRRPWDEAVALRRIGALRSVDAAG